MAYTFFKAQACPSANRSSRTTAWTARDVPRAKERGVALELPLDHVVAPKPGRTDRSAGRDRRDHRRSWVLDIGPKTAGEVAGI
jgi:hypothetical protein